MASPARLRGDRDARELAVLHRAALALAGSLSFTEVLDALARELVYAIERADECSISIWDAAGDQLVETAVQTRYGPPGWPVGQNAEPLSWYPATRALLEEGKGYLEYRLTDPELRAEDRGFLEIWGWRASVEFPLAVDGRSVGLIEIAD